MSPPMKRIALLLALFAFATPALAQETVDIVEAPRSTQGSFHLASFVGVNDMAEGAASVSFGTNLELRVLFARRVGVGVTVGAEFNELHTTVVGGIGPRVRLTDPSASLDISLGYDVRVMRLREINILNWGPVQEWITAGHVLSMRAEGPMSPSGRFRVGGYAEVGLSHAGARWGNLGLSVGFGNR